jgi:hypothetical protein
MAERGGGRMRSGHGRLRGPLVSLDIAEASFQLAESEDQFGMPVSDRDLVQRDLLLDACRIRERGDWRRDIQRVGRSRGGRLRPTTRPYRPPLSMARMFSSIERRRGRAVGGDELTALFEVTHPLLDAHERALSGQVPRVFQVRLAQLPLTRAQLVELRVRTARIVVANVVGPADAVAVDALDHDRKLRVAHAMAGTRTPPRRRSRPARTKSSSHIETRSDVVGGAFATSTNVEKGSALVEGGFMAIAAFLNLLIGSRDRWLPRKTPPTDLPRQNAPHCAPHDLSMHVPIVSTTALLWPTVVGSKHLPHAAEAESDFPDW